MDYILDTHILIWFITDDSKLSKYNKSLIEDKGNSCSVSIISIWEIVIKKAIGKLDLNINLKELINLIRKSDLDIMPIELNHLYKLSNLPFHHKDPFDRLLIATAIADNLMIITDDEKFKNYELKLI